MELSSYSYDIKYRPGNENPAADALSRLCCSLKTDNELYELHNAMCHPGITRLAHLVRCRNLPDSLEDVKRVVGRCNVCSELKLRYYRAAVGNLVKATQPFERLGLDFKGPIPSATRNRYMLTIMDEYSRFPFAFAVPDLTSATVIKCLTELFTTYGTPAYIHSDRGSSFMSSELKHQLDFWNVATSRTTPYNPRGNRQVERYNGIIWKTISRCLTLHSYNAMYGDQLHATRALLLVL